MANTKEREKAYVLATALELQVYLESQDFTGIPAKDYQVDINENLEEMGLQPLSFSEIKALLEANGFKKHERVWQPSLKKLLTVWEK